MEQVLGARLRSLTLGHEVHSAIGNCTHPSVRASRRAALFGPGGAQSHAVAAKPEPHARHGE